MDKTTINEWLSAHMVSRDEFALQLLQRSFRQPSGWVELALAAVLAGGAFMLCRFIEKRGYLEKFIHWHPLRHIVARILWPLPQWRWLSGRWPAFRPSGCSFWRWPRTG